MTRYWLAGAIFSVVGCVEHIEVTLGGDESGLADGAGVAGDTVGGDTSVGDTAGGDTSALGTGDDRSGDLTGGDTFAARGDTLQGDTLQGDTLQGDTLQGDPLQGDTLVGDSAPRLPGLRVSMGTVANFDDTYLLELDGTFVVNVDLGGMTASAALVIMGTMDNFDSLVGSHSISMGYFDGTNQVVSGNGYEHAQVESDVNRAIADDLVGVAWGPGSGNKRNAVEAVEFVPDGLRLRPHWPHSAEATIVVLLFAGRDVLGARVGAPDSHGIAAGAVDVGFAPNLLFFAYNGTKDLEAAAHDVDFQSNTNQNYGFAINGANGLEQYVLYGRETNAEVVTAGLLRARDTAVAITAENGDIVLDSLTPTGFVFTAPAHGFPDQVLPFLALRLDGDVAAGISQTPALDTDPWQEALPFVPEALFTLGHTKNGATIPFNDSGGDDVLSLSFCYGGADGTAFTVYNASEDEVDTVVNMTDVEAGIFLTPFRIDEADGGAAFHFSQLEFVDDAFFTGWRFPAAGFVQHETTPISVPWVAIGSSSR